MQYLNTGLKPGEYYDLDTRILNGLFQSLVDFIEIEKAWMHVVWDKNERKKFKTPWWRTSGLFRSWRCPDAGIAHLKWEMSLTNRKAMGDDNADFQENDEELTWQAKSAIEQFELYNWWKYTRPTRPDASDASGWSDICDKRIEKLKEEGEDDGFALLCSPKTEEERADESAVLKMMGEIEVQYEREDEEMLIRLIKIRKGLWA